MRLGWKFNGERRLFFTYILRSFAALRRLRMTLVVL